MNSIWKLVFRDRKPTQFDVDWGRIPNRGEGDVAGYSHWGGKIFHQGRRGEVFYWADEKKQVVEFAKAKRCAEVVRRRNADIYGAAL